MTEMTGPIRHGAFEWEQLTRDSYWCRLGHGLNVVIRRNRSWKRLRQLKPWRIELWGNPFVVDATFADVEPAMTFAEHVTVARLKSIAKRLR